MNDDHLTICMYVTVTYADGSFVALGGLCYRVRLVLNTNGSLRENTRILIDTDAANIYYVTKHYCLC